MGAGVSREIRRTGSAQVEMEMLGQGELESGSIEYSKLMLLLLEPGCSNGEISSSEHFG